VAASERAAADSQQALFREKAREMREEFENRLADLRKEYAERERELAVRLAGIAERELGIKARADALEKDFAARKAELERAAAERRALLENELQSRLADIQKRENELAQRMDSLDVPSKPAVVGMEHAGLADAEMVEKLIFGFAHQVRNPLGSIRSMAESLSEMKKKEKERKPFEMMIGAVDRLLQRLGQLNDFVRPVQVTRTPTSPAEIARKCALLVEERGRKLGVLVTVHADETVAPVSLNPEHLRIALLNVMVNALEAMPHGGKLEVGVSEDPVRKEAVLAVRDTGIGIAPEHHSRVGEPFFTTKPTGIGLGVPVAKRLLGLYKGKLEFESMPGQGTTVTMRIPQTEA
jgi:signal transduction histidine kinase